MVVLLLIVGIQKEDNEDVITTIQNLDTKTQRDIMYFYTRGIQKVDKGIFASGEERTDVVSLHLPCLNQSYSQNLEISAIDLQNTLGLCLFLRIESETKAIYHCSCTVPKSKISTINLETNKQDSTAVYWLTVSS